MISVADGWQHGPRVDRGARWEPAAVGAAVRELLAKAPPPGAGVRRAMSRVRTRRRPRCRPGGARSARGPTRRCSTDSRASTARGSRSSTATRASPSTTCARGGGRARRCLLGHGCAARDGRRLAAPELVGRRRAVLGGVALRRDRRARSRRACAPGRSASSSHQTGAGIVVVPARVPRHRLSGAGARNGFHGTGDRRARPRRRCPRRAVDRARRRRRRRRSGGDPLDVGHDVRPEGRRAHAPEPARRGRHDRGRARHARPASRSCFPMPITHVAGLTYGVLLPVTSAITAVLMDTWDPGRALELVEREHIAVMISTPVFMRTMIDHPTFARDRHVVGPAVLARRRGRGAGDGARGRATRFGCWCKRTYGSTEYPTLTTGRLGDDPERDATTDGCLIDRGRAAHRRSRDARRRRAGSTGRAARPRAGDVRRLPRSRARRATRSSPAAGSAPAISRATTASTSRSSTA